LARLGVAARLNKEFALQIGAGEPDGDTGMKRIDIDRKRRLSKRRPRTRRPSKRRRITETARQAATPLTRIANKSSLSDAREIIAL
jgi:hypothetical protein